MSNGPDGLTKRHAFEGGAVGAMIELPFARRAAKGLQDR